MLDGLYASEDALKYVTEGFAFEFKEEIIPLDRNDFEIFEDESAYFVLKEIVTNLKLRKFLGCFHRDVTSFEGRPMSYAPLFTIEKGDSTKTAPKFRVIFNAAVKHKLSPRQQEILDRRYDSEANFQAFLKEDFITTLNENMQTVGIRLDLAKDVIRGLYKSKLL